MIRFLIITIAILSAGFGKAQFRSDDTQFSAKYSYGTVGPARYSSYSLCAELFLGDHFSANYNFDLSYSTDGIRNLHTPLGLIAGPPLIALGMITSRNETENSPFYLGKGGILLGFILLVAPDGFGIHIPIRNHVDISPYANVLGLDFIRDRNNGDHWIKYSCSFGGKISFLYKGFSAFVFAEARKPARFEWMKGIGFGVGYYF